MCYFCVSTSSFLLFSIKHFCIIFLLEFLFSIDNDFVLMFGFDIGWINLIRFSNDDDEFHAYAHDIHNSVCVCVLCEINNNNLLESNNNNYLLVCWRTCINQEWSFNSLSCSLCLQHSLQTCLHQHSQQRLQTRMQQFCSNVQIMVTFTYLYENIFYLFI